MPDTTHHAAIIMRKPEADQRKMLEDALRGGFAPDAKSIANVCRELSLTDQARFLLLAKAAGDSRDNLEKIAIARAHMADTLAATPDEKTTDVVFVIHGIRDKGFWTHKVARAVKQQGEREQRVFRSFTRSYGYFALFPFVLPSGTPLEDGLAHGSLRLDARSLSWREILLCRAFERRLSPGARLAALSGGEIPSCRFRGQRRASRLSLERVVARQIGRPTWTDRQEFSIMSRPGVGSSPFRESASDIHGAIRLGSPDTMTSTTSSSDAPSEIYTRPSSSSDRMEPALVKPIERSRALHREGRPPTDDVPHDTPPMEAVRPRLLRLATPGAAVLLVGWAV